jgi:DNA-binding MarR family transcriptional regulator
VHRLVDLDALGLDPERARLVTEIFALQNKVHDEALSIAGPTPNPSDLTMQQMRVLGFIGKEPGLAGHELGDRLGVSAPTASGLVDRLVEKGLLVRVDDRDDRRVRRLHLTDAGRALTREMDSLVQRAMMKVIQNMTVADLEIIRHSSEVFLEAMERAKS